MIYVCIYVGILRGVKTSYSIFLLESVVLDLDGCGGAVPDVVEAILHNHVHALHQELVVDLKYKIIITAKKKLD